MRNILKSGFLWQFVGGFALGAVGMVTLQPGAEANETSANPAATAAHAAR